MNARDSAALSPSAGQLLDAVPVPNRAVRCERQAERETVLSIPLRRRWYMGPPLAWVFPFSTHRRVALDALGGEVWRACDGARTAEQIVEAFAERHGLTFHEARLSVMLFLRDLVRRGVVVMAGRGEQRSAA